MSQTCTRVSDIHFGHFEHCDHVSAASALRYLDRLCHLPSYCVYKVLLWIGEDYELWVVGLVTGVSPLAWSCNLYPGEFLLTHA